jgi:hypothetical protein
MLRRIFGLGGRGNRRLMVTSKCGTVLSVIQYIIQIIKSKGRWAGHVARLGERRGVYRVVVGRPDGKRPLGRHRPRRQ